MEHSRNSLLDQKKSKNYIYISWTCEIFCNLYGSCPTQNWVVLKKNFTDALNIRSIYMGKIIFNSSVKFFFNTTQFWVGMYRRTHTHYMPYLAFLFTYLSIYLCIYAVSSKEFAWNGLVLVYNPTSSLDNIIILPIVQLTNGWISFALYFFQWIDGPSVHAKGRGQYFWKLLVLLRLLFLSAFRLLHICCE